MSRVLGELGEDVEDRPPGGPPRPGLEPGGGRQGPGGAEIGDGPDQLVGGPRGSVVIGEQAVDRVAVLDLELATVLLDHRLVEDPLGRTLHDEAGPLALHGGDVLDDAAQAQLADRRPAAKLLRGQAADGVAQEPAVRGEGVQQVFSLVGGDGGHVSLLRCRLPGYSTHPGALRGQFRASIQRTRAPVLRAAGSRRKAAMPGWAVSTTRAFRAVFWPALPGSGAGYRVSRKVLSPERIIGQPPLMLFRTSLSSGNPSWTTVSRTRPSTGSRSNATRERGSAAAFR